MPRQEHQLPEPPESAVEIFDFPAETDPPLRDRPRIRVSRRISEVTATRWSGSDACRSPRTRAIPSATSRGAPSKSWVSQASRSSTGPNRKSKPIERESRVRAAGAVGGGSTVTQALTYAL